MTLDLEDRQSAGNDYDDGSPEWQKPLTDSEFDPEASFATPDATDDNLPEDHPSRSDAKKGFSPGALSSAEKGEGASPAGGMAASQEADKLNSGADTIGKGFNAKDYAGGAGKNALLKLATKRNAGIGGGAAGTIMILATMFFGTASFELIHIRESITGGRATGGIQERVLGRRKNKAVGTILKDVAAVANRGNALSDAIFASKKLDKALGVYGVDIVRKGGKLEGITYKVAGKEVAHDLKGLSDDAIKNILEDATNVDEFKAAAKKALKYEAAGWSGKASKRLWQAGKIRFSDWLNRKSSDKAITEGEKINDVFRNSDAPTDEKVSVTDGKPAEQLKDTNGDGHVSAQEAKQSVDSSSDTIKGAEDYGNEMRADPTLTDEGAIPNFDQATADAVEAEGAKVATTLENAAAPEVLNILGKAAPSLTKSALTGGVKGLSFTAIPQEVCRIKGTLGFIASIRNVIFAAELARFTAKMLTASDRQKAGILSSDGLKLVMLYMHRPNPANGKSALHSGGMRYIMGDRTAKVSSVNLGKVSTSRANGGILASIDTFLNTNPVTRNMVSPTACKVVHNGFVQAGTFIGGTLFTVFGGELTGIPELNIATSISLQVINEVAFIVGTPLLIKAGAHLIMNGMENGELVGDAMASGAGVMQGMNGGKNGLRPVTKKKAALLRVEADKEHRVELAHMSIKERYFDLGNYDSVASTALFNYATAVSSPRYTFNAIFTGVLSKPLFSGFSFGSLFSSKALAASESSTQCNDPQIVNNDLETDPYCNPVMADTPDLDISESRKILLDNKLLDDTGKEPQGEFADYIKDCFEGRAGIMYTKEVDKEGGNHPASNHCIEDGDPLSGDNVGKNARFANYYGFMIDAENFADTLGIDSSATSDTPTDTLPTIVAGDTSNIACAAGTDSGVADGYKDGKLNKIRLCKVQGFVVNSQVSKSFDSMSTAAASAGISFGGGGGFRTMDGQISVYQKWCHDDGITPSPPPFPKAPGQTVRCPGGGAPGYSNHQMGFAADLGCDGESIPKAYSAASSNRCWQWLVANAANYGFYEYGKGNPSSRSSRGYEGWHWSVDGN